MRNQSSGLGALAIAVSTAAAIALFWAIILLVALMDEGDVITKSSKGSAWSSLEVAKLISTFATPIVVACLGIYFHRIAKQFEHSQWSHQKVVEKRLQVYDSLCPQLNDLLCYFTHIGKWRDVSPEWIVQKKRKIDREIHLAGPLFSNEFFDSCMDFMNICYETYNGWGKDATLRTEWEDRREAHKNWKEEWNQCFSRDFADHEEIRAAYSRIMDAFSADLGLRGEK